jgi:hypothetical protein
MEFNFFVQSFEGIHMDDETLARLDYTDGSMENPFRFLSQVFNDVYIFRDLRMYTEVDVTVYLTSGDHFLFSCHKDFFEDYSKEIDESEVTLFCDNIFSLQALYPTSDNVNFVFKSMLCMEKDDKFPNLSETEEAFFDEHCVSAMN